MRTNLKNISESDYWVYGLREDDLGYILRLTEDFINARNEQLNNKVTQAKSDYPDPDVHDELISDLAYYTDVDTQYLWQFCLWRFQGILEGLVTGTFLPVKPSKPLNGLRRKLDELRNAGYTLAQPDYDELIDWASLRNALSHAPPEQYSVGHNG